jgi:hypothetical protein
VALVVLDIWALATGRGFLVTAFPPLLAGALWRFVEQRAKSTIQAYWFLITLEGEAGRSAQAGISSAGTVSSIQPPPSTRDPS